MLKDRWRGVLSDARFGWIGVTFPRSLTDVTKQIAFIVRRSHAGIPRLQNTAIYSNTRKSGRITVFTR
jgi:hypothetical protein